VYHVECENRSIVDLIRLIENQFVTEIQKDLCLFVPDVLLVKVQMTSDIAKCNEQTITYHKVQ